jgi:transcriptional regulator with XRE-family HTH domain
MNRYPVWPELRDHIDARGFKREYVAMKSGIKPAKLSLILNGRRRLTVDDLQAICDAIDTSPNAFFHTKEAANQ